MGFFSRFSKGDTEASLKAKGVTEYRVASRSVQDAAARAAQAQADMGAGWDVVDDERVEAVAQHIADEAQRAAGRELARQEAERTHRKAAARARLLAAATRVQDIARARLAVRAVVPNVQSGIASLQEAVSTHKAHWRTVQDRFSMAHDEIDRDIEEAQCWRCGQKGLPPLEDEDVFARPPLPDAPGSARERGVTEEADRLLKARREAVDAWLAYNNVRLHVERLRLDANYHPAIAHRFTTSRTCEICGSTGQFHAGHIAGTRREIELGPRHWRTEGEHGLHIRYAARMGDAWTEVDGFFGKKWVKLSTLSKDGAIKWVQAPVRPRTVSEHYKNYMEKMEQWREWTSKGLVSRLTGPSSWGCNETHVLTTVEETRYVSEPAMPNPIERAERQLEWPTPAYWRNDAPYFPHWKGVQERLIVRPNVVYPVAEQDPISKIARRIGWAKGPIRLPTIQLLQERKGYYQGARRGAVVPSQ
ncbi:hypothetical protein [Trinickia sp. Y13]|uniref:hypothetical protein n=1 Tax=Trinickia sp. Y13 TaxID=2917807 RepID=UPI0024062ED4|nr:hypothetical protein [Trinickia sp. Y13]MDG0024539.1 hypothetical protein [Trinickia sp. Y13]